MLELDVHSVQHSYAAGRLTPSDLIATVYDRLESQDGDGVWISVVSRNEALARARELDGLSRQAREALPLFGLPFSVKDCIDVADLQTTAGCPDFAYTAETTNLAVARALDAGAILVGKTNLDQFATGLVGVRTPYGVARNPFDAELIPGGSSSGAAVSVASGQVAFAFETIDVMVVPTTGTVYRISEVENDPITLNANLGYYTNFVNLLDLAAVAVPNGFLPGGFPMGITIIGPAFSDAWLAGLAGAFHDRRGVPQDAATPTNSATFVRSASGP